MENLLRSIIRDAIQNEFDAGRLWDSDKLTMLPAHDGEKGCTLRILLDGERYAIQISKE